MTNSDDSVSSHEPLPRDGHHAAMPSLDLLRSLTDEHVLRAVMEHGRLTRADIALKTGISKPTISESAKRLSAAGVLVDTGERTSGRGRAGSYYTLTPRAGTALVVSIRPDGISAQAIDPFAATVRASAIGLTRGAGPDEATRALLEVAGQVQPDEQRFRLAVVSAADPVDRATGKLVHLPDAPFMVGDLDPTSVLAPLVSGSVLVDNDINWAARAERDAGQSTLDDFVYVHLGEGLGCAVVTDGQVSRGHQGVAGEIAHIVTTGPGGAAIPLTEVFAALNLRRSGTTAIDVDRLLASLDHTTPDETTTLATLARAVSGVLIAAIALADPQEIVIGGPWGRNPRIVKALAHELSVSPRRVPVRPAVLTDAPDEQGARTHGLASLRTLIATKRDDADGEIGQSLTSRTTSH
jgi:predicted NBD/HSP70 family sugar kinase